MPAAKTFLDTNVLVYAFSSATHRASQALAILAVPGATISVQVLNEFANVSLRKQKRSWEETRECLRLIRQIVEDPVALTVETHEAGVEIAERYQLHIYDAMIVAAALQAECDTLYTEDLQHGQVIDGMTVRNPFTS